MQSQSTSTQAHNTQYIKGGNTRSGGLSDFAVVVVFLVLIGYVFLIVVAVMVIVFLVLIVCVLLIDCVRSSNRGRPPFNHFRTEASCC